MLIELHFNLLLAQILRSKSIAEQAFRVLQPDHLKQAGARSAHVILFYAMKKYFTQHKITPDDAALSIEVQAFCDTYQSSRPEFVEEVNEVFTTFSDFRPKVTDKSAPMALQIIQQIANQFIHRPAVNELLTNALAKESISGIAKQLTDMEAKIAATAGRSSIDGVASLDMSDAGGARVTTGIPWIDARFGKGAGPVLGSVLGIIAPQGHGKCLAPETKVRLFDGRVKMACDVVAGDLLMGPDSKPRTVLSTAAGEDDMFEIVPAWSEPFVCNAPHVLTLQNVSTLEVVDIPLNEYLLKNSWFKERHKLFRVPVDYPAKELPVHPYLVGAWLGDGTRKNGSPNITKNDDEFLNHILRLATLYGVTGRISADPRNGVKTAILSDGHNGGRPTVLRSFFRGCLNPANEKFIPKEYLHSSREQRLQLFAALVDTDGHTQPGGTCVEWSTKDTPLKDGMVELARSLGFYVSVATKVVDGNSYWRLHIGQMCADIPTVIPRKKILVSTDKRPKGTRSKFTVRSVGRGAYAGFELDGDGRFLLEDFTVTHNTSLGIQLAVSQALQQRHALLILAEEGLSKAIKRRIVACATGISTPELEVANDIVGAALGTRNPLAIKEKLAAVDKYLHVVDLVNKPVDLEAALNEITTLRLSGRDPTYVYVDWAGPIATKMRSVGFRGMELRTQYDALKVLGMELAQISANTNTIVAVSHQMAGAQVKKGWNAVVDQYCAMECSTFTETFKYVMVVNPREPRSGLSWLTIAKSRDDPLATRLIVKLRGELSQFADVTNEYTNNPTKATGFKVKNTNKPTVPSE